jgi:hypothetical protein
MQSYDVVLISLASIDPLSPALIVPLPIAALLGGTVTPILTLALSIVVANWYMLFRINLFKKLSRS